MGVIFSYYFIEAGSEFVWVHMLAMIIFVISFGLNVQNLSQQQMEKDKLTKEQQIQKLEQELNQIQSTQLLKTNSQHRNVNVNMAQDIKPRTKQTTDTSAGK